MTVLGWAILGGGAALIGGIGYIEYKRRQEEAVKAAEAEALRITQNTLAQVESQLKASQQQQDSGSFIESIPVVGDLYKLFGG